MSKSSRTALERMPSTDSMVSEYIPESLKKESKGTSLSVTPSERKRYKFAYDNVEGTSQEKRVKRKYIAKHLRIKTKRRATRKRKIKESRRVVDRPIVDPPKWLNTANATRKTSPDEYTKFKRQQIAEHMSLSREQKVKAASDRRTDRGKNYAHLIDHRYGVFDPRK